MYILNQILNYTLHWIIQKVGSLLELPSYCDGDTSTTVALPEMGIENQTFPEDPHNTLGSDPIYPSVQDIQPEDR